MAANPKSEFASCAKCAGDGFRVAFLPTENSWVAGPGPDQSATGRILAKMAERRAPNCDDGSYFFR